MGKVGVLLMSFLKTWVSAMSFKAIVVKNMGVLLSLKSMCFEKVGVCPLITAMGKVGVLLRVK